MYYVILSLYYHIHQLEFKTNLIHFYYFFIILNYLFIFIFLKKIMPANNGTKKKESSGEITYSIGDIVSFEYSIYKLHD